MNIKHGLIFLTILLWAVSLLAWLCYGVAGGDIWVIAVISTSLLAIIGFFATSLK